MSGYKYEFDSQLLRHYSPGLLHGPSTNLAAVYDENQNPLVFTIAKTSDLTNGSLCVTVADLKTGKNTTFNYSLAFGIEGKVMQIAACQDDTRNIYLAFTAQTAPGSPVKLYVSKQTSPNDWRFPDKMKSALLQPDPNVTFRDVRDIFFCPNVRLDSDPAKTGPFLAVHYMAGQSLDELRLDRVLCDTTNWYLRVDNSMSLIPPWTPRKNLYQQPLDKAVLVFEQRALITASLWELPSISSRVLVLYYTPLAVKGDPLRRELVLDANYVKAPSVLGTCLNSGSFWTNDLLIGGDGLYFYGQDALLKMSGDWRIMPTLLKPPGGAPTDVFFRNVADMATAQSGSQVSVFIRTNDEQICNLMINAGSEPSIVRRTLPVMAGKVVDFAPIFHAPKQAHHFMVVGDDYQHSVLQFKPGTSTWESQSFLVEAAGANAEKPAAVMTVSYHTHIIIKDKNDQPARDDDGQPITVMISASDSVTVTMNGVDTSLSTFGISVQTDFRSCLSIVSPVDSLGSTAVFTLRIGGQQIGDYINPAVNVKNDLQPIDSGDKLTSAKLKVKDLNGNDDLIVNKPRISRADINAAGKNLAALHKQFSDVPNDGTTMPSTQSIFSEGWAAWHYIVAAENAVASEWKMVGEKIVAIEIKIAGAVNDVLTLAVDSVSRILKAVSFVLKQLEVEIDRIVDWIGMVFEWDKIQAVQKDIAGITGQFLEQSKSWTKSLVPTLDNALETAFGSVDQMLSQMTTSAMVNDPPIGSLADRVKKGASQQSASPATKVPETGAAPMQKGNTSPGTQWTSNQAMSGNLSSGSSTTMSPQTAQFCFIQNFGKTHSPENAIITSVPLSQLCQYAVCFPDAPTTHTDFGPVSAEAVDAMDALWTKLGGIVEGIETAMSDLGSDIMGLLKGRVEDIGHELLNLVVKFVRAILNIIKLAIEAILDALVEIIDELITSVLGATLNLPFLAAFWTLVTRETLPTSILDICCILAAIPTTAGAMLMAPDVNEFWPDLTDWRNGTNFGLLDIPKDFDIEPLFARIKTW